MSIFRQIKFFTIIFIISSVFQGSFGLESKNDGAASEILDYYPVLLKTIRENSTNTCTGVPISENLITTSASCVDKAISVTVYGDNKRVKNIFEAINATTSEISVHPEYLKNPEASSPHNIAILNFPSEKPRFNVKHQLAISKEFTKFVAKQKRWIKIDAELEIEESIVTLKSNCSDNSELLCGESTNKNLCEDNYGAPLWINDVLVGIGIKSECSKSGSLAHYVSIANNYLWIAKIYFYYA